MLIPTFLVPLSLLATAAFADDGYGTGAAADSTAASSGCLLYTIKANDTGCNIAKSFGLEFSIVNASNPNVVWEKIAIGESVLIPKGHTTQPVSGVTPAPSCPAAAIDALPNAPRSDTVTLIASGSASAAGTGSAPSAGSAPAPAAGTAPAASASAAPATSDCKAYIVVSGDTGYKIVQKNGITMAEMKAQNPDIVWEKLEADQILVLPPSANGTDLLPRPDCKPAGIIPPATAAAASAGPASGSGSVTVASAAASAAPTGSIKAAVPPASPTAAAPPAGSATASKPAGLPAPAAPPPPPPPPPAAAAAGAAAAGSSSSSSGGPTGKTVGGGGGGAEPVSVIKHISPASNSCASAKFKDECATAADAAAPIVASFAQYGVTTAGEQAALLSWMLFESGGFKYNRNHFPEPGRPGQGTRTMMMPNYVEEYAQSIAALKTAVAGVTDPDALLKLVMVPEYTFGSAGWFYSAKCDDATKTGLKAGTAAGWEAWLKNCVKTEIGEAGPEGRKALYDKAREALGVKLD